MFRDIMALLSVFEELNDSKSLIARFIYKPKIKKQIREALLLLKNIRVDLNILFDFIAFCKATGGSLSDGDINIHSNTNNDIINIISIKKSNVKEFIKLYKTGHILIYHTDIIDDTEFSHDIEYYKTINNNQTILPEVMYQYTLEYVEDILHETILSCH